MSDFDEPIPVVVIDPGSGVFKAGRAGEEFPQHCFQTVVGVHKTFDESVIMKRKKKEIGKILSARDGTEAENGYAEQYVVGEKALEQRAELELSYPVERGNVQDWEQMEYIYEHVFLDLLEVEPEETFVLLTETPFTSRKSRETTAELLFEVFGIAALHIMQQPVLSLYASGRTTGLVIDSGDAVTHAVPVYDGYPLNHSIERLNLGGRDVTNNLQRILLERGVNLSTTSEHHFAREVKEELGYVSLNFDDDADWSSPESKFEKKFRLPDGQFITIGKELFRCTEIMFNPQLVGSEALGLHDMAFRAWESCEVDVRNGLYNNIVLSGGNTLFTNFKERITRDLCGKTNSYRPFRVYSDSLRQFSSWIGGSVMASMGTFEKYAVSFDEYQDHGSSIIHNRRM
ncbi:actin [Acrasis kona]|uniref:Actin n=1 Tax=Acrasis kona TaxID=1008807 RepID=A0AAW2YNC3_9EUKA